MSKISLTPNASGTGTFTIASPNSNTNRTLTLPDADGALLAGAQAPFIPATVSGATQALDVGAANFFDAGTLIADTTVSFTNVPTEARWTYTAEAGVDEGYLISSASNIVAFDLDNEDTDPASVFLKSDGTKMYMVGRTNDRIYQYSLSTAGELSTTSYDSVSFDPTSQDTSPFDVYFRPDGTSMFILGTANGSVYQYTLSTAWDISTASYASKNLSVASEGSPTGFYFKPDGTKMYLTTFGGSSTVYQYSLSTAWDISTASYDSVSFNTNAQVTNAYGVEFQPDGAKMFVTDVSGGSIYQYSLSTAWNVSTASYDSASFAVGASPYSSRFSSSGNYLYCVRNANDEVRQYSTATYYSITFPSSVSPTPSGSFTSTSRFSYNFWTSDGGTTVNSGSAF